MAESSMGRVFSSDRMLIFFSGVRLKCRTITALEPERSMASDIPLSRPEHPFSAPYAPPDEAIAARLLAQAPQDAAAAARVDARATRLIEGIRAASGGLGGIEDFLHAY